MPTEVNTSAKHGKLGDLSTYTVGTSAIPVDAANSEGSIPTISATFADGEDVVYLIDEDFSIKNPTIGSYDGKIVSVSKGAGSNLHTLDVHNIMSRLNVEKRLYPLSDGYVIASSWLPVNTLEYWTQQCGIFATAVPGDVLYYQSQHGHHGAWGKGITRSLRSSTYAVGTLLEAFSSEVYNGRVLNHMPKNGEYVLTFPPKEKLSDMGSYLPLMIPAPGSSEVLVWGGVVIPRGTGRSIRQSWHMWDSASRKKAIRVTTSAAGGITLQTSEDGVNFTSRLVAPISDGKEYQYYVGIESVATGTRFSLRVFDVTGTQVANGSVTVAGSGIKGSMSLYEIRFLGLNAGSGSPFLVGENFISRMKAIPLGWLARQKSIITDSNRVKPRKFIPGFSGNVWEHIKQFCAIYRLDVSYRNSKLTIEPRQRDLKVGASLSSLEQTVTHREPARNVEVISQEHSSTGGWPYKVMWSADTVYQVGVGQVEEFTVQTDHSIEVLSNPVCVTGISPFPYKEGAGQYVVTGSDGYIVSPQFWQDQGGSITVDITPNEGEIKVRIKGPDFDSTRAPYRISEGDAGRPALHITGLGVRAEPRTIKVPTGNSKAAKDVGVTIDSPFISDTAQAFDAAVVAARSFAVPETSVSFAEPTSYDEVSKLGTVPAGALVKADGNVYRVKDANQTHSVTSGNAVPHNTIYQLKRSFKGQTIGQMNAYNADKPIGKVNLKPMKVMK